MKTLELNLKQDVLIVQPEETGNMNYWVTLHSKDWDFICLGSELTEEIASEFFEYDDFLNRFEIYIDTVPSIDKSALKLFIKIFESKGFYWLKHNVRNFSLYDPRSKTGCHDLEEEDIITKQWQEAEEKTFKNPLIFVKK